MEIVAIDIGGTHARFSIAEVSNGRVLSLGEETTFKTAEHASLQLAWERFGENWVVLCHVPQLLHGLARFMVKF